MTRKRRSAGRFAASVDIRRRHGEDQPAATGIDRAPLKHIVKKRAHGIRLRAVQEGVNSGDHVFCRGSEGSVRVAKINHGHAAEDERTAEQRQKRFH